METKRALCLAKGGLPRPQVRLLRRHPLAALGVAPRQRRGATPNGKRSLLRER